MITRSPIDSDDLARLDERLGAALAGISALAARGRVTEVLGNLIKVNGIRAPLGEVCALTTRQAGRIGLAEVIGFAGGGTFLSMLGPTTALSPDVEVEPLGRRHTVGVGDGLLGRVLDGFGVPLDSAGQPEGTTLVEVDRAPPNPLARHPIDRPFVTGSRAIDTLLACGIGQRLGIFAPAGVGKSTLLGELAARSPCDINVIALVGERGREVGDFIRDSLGPAAMQRTIIVAATSDRPAMERVRAAQVATAIAEYFRDRGSNVLLLVDSLTRLARAQREIGLALGEPPTRRGFPPSVFTLLPRLLERAGPDARGAITAFYTILTEGDEQDDPVAEEVRAILDGHIVLSRILASAGHFPAIDLLASNSRLANQVLNAEQRTIASDARAMLAKYDEMRLLVQIGEYRAGLNADTDRAIALYPKLMAFFNQPCDTTRSPDLNTFASLRDVLASR